MRNLLLLFCCLGLIGCATVEPTPQPTPLPEPTNTLPPATPILTEAPTEAAVINAAATAADANVTSVRAIASGSGWTFLVTIDHLDTGWDDYADGWDVVLPDGTVLKSNAEDSFTRLLLHPHENERPFTRGQSGITIPEGITMVTVRAHDLVDGFGGEEVVVDLEATSGDRFTVEQ